MQQIHLLTSNPDKIKAANIVFNKHDVAVLPLELNMPEIQAATSIEIARHAARQAYEQTGKPVIREDPAARCQLHACSHAVRRTAPS